MGVSDKPRLTSSLNSEIPERGESVRIRLYRFLDWLHSAWNRGRKNQTAYRRWGQDWHDKVRSGRRYTRVHESYEPFVEYELRAEPGWEMTCQNCRVRSLVTDALIAIYTIDNHEYRDNILEQWQEQNASRVSRGFAPTPKPTPATAWCPNCRYRPGAPE